MNAFLSVNQGGAPLETGKIADLVLLHGNPLQNKANLRVFKAGLEVSASRVVKHSGGRL
jgi:imidazolonepropionase-like amidohydrolase